MSEQNNKLPIGLLLKNAGLISEKQLQNALAIQKKYTQMKLGEILVLRGGIEAKTINFFVDRWQKLLDSGKRFPLGYYLKKAFLLDDRQIEIILREQQNSQQQFGAIAVQKGWISPRTVEFFLSSLTFKPPELISFSWLEEYNQQTLHLEEKYVNHSLILSRIFAWTGGNSSLTKIIGHAFAESNFNIPAGLEIDTVDRFVEKKLIQNWQKSDRAAYIRLVAQNLLNNRQCSPELLLQEYGNILLSGNKRYQSSPEQEELLTLGLVVRDDEKLRIANLIYQQIFNRDWSVRELKRLQSDKSQTNTQAALAIAESPNTRSTVTTDSKAIVPKPIEVDRSGTNGDRSGSPVPQTKIGSLITLCSIALLVPLFLFANNYYFSRSQEQRSIASSLSNKEQLQQFCREIDFADSASSLKLISKLESDRQKSLENFANSLEVFPDDCETALNRLRVLAAPLLGKESRVLEAIRHLCKIPANSETYVEAEVWLDRWYNSPSWGRETKFLLQELEKYDGAGCPAAHFTEYYEG